MALRVYFFLYFTCCIPPWLSSRCSAYFIIGWRQSCCRKCNGIIIHIIGGRQSWRSWQRRCHSRGIDCLMLLRWRRGIISRLLLLILRYWSRYIFWMLLLLLLLFLLMVFKFWRRAVDIIIIGIAIIIIIICRIICYRSHLAVRKVSWFCIRCWLIKMMMIWCWYWSRWILVVSSIIVFITIIVLLLLGYWCWNSLCTILLITCPRRWLINIWKCMGPLLFSWR